MAPKQTSILAMRYGLTTPEGSRLSRRLRAPLHTGHPDMTW